MNKKKIIIAGAGASGMVAAIEAAKRNIDVTLLEANDEVGKKIYATGNGRCNLTNKKMSESFYRSYDMNFVKNIIDSFGCKETLRYFEELGLMFKDRDGYVYPMSGQASSVAEVLFTACQLYGVHIICNSPVISITKQNNYFTVRTPEKTFKSEGLILSCGSIAGISKGKQLKINGYDLAKSMGHKMIPIVSALTGLQCENKEFYKTAAGVRCDGKIEIWTDNGKSSKPEAEDMGELQLTAYGVSGIPAFQVSRYAAYDIREKKKVMIQLDFLRNITKEEICYMIHKKRKINKNITILQCFTGILNDRLAAALIKENNTDVNKKACDISDEEINKIAETIKAYRDTITGVNDFTSSQVLAGGMRLDEFKETMESKLVENLYMTGEMLDADGMCGGYNLQWAWATGYIAGNNILKKQPSESENI